MWGGIRLPSAPIIEDWGCSSIFRCRRFEVGDGECSSIPEMEDGRILPLSPPKMENGRRAPGLKSSTRSSDFDNSGGAPSIFDLRSSLVEDKKPNQDSCHLRNFFRAPESPGHALHEKGLQRQKGVVPLTSSQERRVAVVPLTNRGS